jgi:hypothetical protein
MLAVTTYSPEYISQVRARFEAHVTSLSDVDAPVFNMLVLALDRHFVHRVRNREGKDGNAINEVRMLCDSLTENEGVLTANSTIKYRASESVLGLEIGDPISVSRDGFARLVGAFLDEMSVRYGEASVVGA